MIMLGIYACMPLGYGAAKKRFVLFTLGAMVIERATVYIPRSSTLLYSLKLVQPYNISSTPSVGVTYTVERV